MVPVLALGLGALAHAAARGWPVTHRLVLPSRAPSPALVDDLDEYSLAANRGDEEALRRRFKELATQLHPDVSTADDAEARFATISAEYDRLLRECRTMNARATLMRTFMRVGGLAAAATVMSAVSSEPALAALVATSFGTLSNVLDRDDPAEGGLSLGGALSRVPQLGAAAVDDGGSGAGNATEVAAEDENVQRATAVLVARAALAESERAAAPAR